MTGRDVILEMINEMSVESLTELLYEGLSCGYCPIGLNKCSGCSADCAEQLIEYLKSEVE